MEASDPCRTAKWKSLMSENRFEKGATSLILHLIFGAIAGGVIFDFAAWMFIPPPLGLYLTAAGSILLGIAAAVGRNRFWVALGNNPLFEFWRRLAGIISTL